MTIATALAPAARRLLKRDVTAFMASTDQTIKGLVDLAQESAVAIARATDWQALRKIHTITGDGSTILHDMPEDYSRMLKKSHPVLTSSLGNRLTRVDDDEWLQQQIQPTGNPPSWILTGGKFGISPFLAVDEEVKFFYVSNRITSANKTQFESDDDQFKLPERLITLAVIYRWREARGLASTGDLENFNTAFIEESGDDRAPGIIMTGPARMPGNVRNAYPYPLGS